MAEKRGVELSGLTLDEMRTVEIAGWLAEEPARDTPPPRPTSPFAELSLAIHHQSS